MLKILLGIERETTIEDRRIKKKTWHKAKTDKKEVITRKERDGLKQNDGEAGGNSVKNKEKKESVEREEQKFTEQKKDI